MKCSYQNRVVPAPLRRAVRRRPTMNASASTLALTILAISALTLPARAEAPVESVGLFLLRVQEESAAPFVQHCGAKVPELKQSLEAEYLRFKKRYRKATAPLRAQLGTNEELSRPASRELIEQFEEMGAQSLAQVRELDARPFCLTLKDNLSNATEKTIQQNMQSTLAHYTAAVRHSR
jgi:hypothetical protein